MKAIALRLGRWLVLRNYTKAPKESDKQAALIHDLALQVQELRRELDRAKLEAIIAKVKAL